MNRRSPLVLDLIPLGQVELNVLRGLEAEMHSRGGPSWEAINVPST